ncbi:hypothetical protein NHX12_028655 [Muraenolepis orangiensis]|uniref:Uncharacterized protein n=1 Tax=Muraenolepis orangiensis TaxID=630683 RepID=A0A9Q0EC74_9TELE|nr:hypothetical protein NHX12_028655 [Muraenolepis orangiensis]
MKLTSVALLCLLFLTFLLVLTHFTLGRPPSNKCGYPQPGPNHPSAGGYSYRGNPGGHMNSNPKNQIPSPGYAGSYGYGGHGGQGGSPFSRTVEGMGINPSVRSKGFGRTPVVAAGAGAITGMAVGYGLGRFPRPHFHFHSHREENYYNHYTCTRRTAPIPQTGTTTAETTSSAHPL